MGNFCFKDFCRGLDIRAPEHMGRNVQLNWGKWSTILCCIFAECWPYHHFQFVSAVLWRLFRRSKWFFQINWYWMLSGNKALISVYRWQREAQPRQCRVGYYVFGGSLRQTLLFYQIGVSRRWISQSRQWLPALPIFASIRPVLQPCHAF